jgi:hypothetical protein
LAPIIPLFVEPQVKPEAARPVSVLAKAANYKVDLAIGLIAMAERAAKANRTKRLRKILARLRKLLSSM